MPLTFRAYQVQAVRTSVAKDLKFIPSPFLTDLPVPHGKVLKRIKTAALGLVGEVGEFADLLKKVVGHDHNPDLAKFAKEAGDVFWYVAELSDVFGIEMLDDDVDAAQANSAAVFLGGPLGVEESPFDVAAEYALSAAVAAAQVAKIYNALVRPSGANWRMTSIHLSNVITHVAVCLHLMGIPLSRVLEGNIAKLKERYPTGFDSERSINRGKEDV